MMTTEPGGYGPWFCAFVVNTGKDPKKHTHVVSHSMPHLVVDALNRAGGCWIILLKIGPFNVWRESLAFLQAWLYQTRGKIHRIERGYELYKHYAERYCLHLWSQTRTRDDAIAYWQQLPPPTMAPSSAIAAAAMAPSTTTTTMTTQTSSCEMTLRRYTEWLTSQTAANNPKTIDQLRILQKQLLLNGSNFLLGWLNLLLLLLRLH